MPKDYYAYIRVSTVKQGKTSASLPEQKNAIQAFADRSGFVISEWFEEQETAAKRGRPIFGKMIKALKKGKAKGLIIHKIDRGARNYRDWADLIDLMEQGVEIYTAGENIDLTSRGGRLTADLQAVIAADYIRNLREETKKGIYGRLKQGLYPFAAPYGYLDTGRGNVKKVDLIKAPLVKKLFELYGTGGYSLLDLRQESERLGLVSKSGKTLSKNSLSLMLRNPFYIGLMHVKTSNEMYPGIHEPLISKVLFDRVQAILDGRHIKKSLVHDFLFKRLLTCKHCNKTLTGERQKGHVYYRCHTRQCATKGVRENRVDTSIQGQLVPIQFTPFEMEYMMSKTDLLKRTREKSRTELLQAQELKLGQLEARLERLTDALVDGLIDKEAYDKRRTSLLQEKVKVEEHLMQIQDGSYTLAQELEKFFELVFTAQQTYKCGVQEEKQQLLKRVSSNRFVDRKNVVVELKPHFMYLAQRPVCDQSCLQRDKVRTLEVLFDTLVQFFKQKM